MASRPSSSSPENNCAARPWQGEAARIQKVSENDIDNSSAP